MSREGKLTKQIDEGNQAENLIKNPIFEKVFNSLEQEFLTAWKSSSVEDSAEREKLYYLFQALQALKTAILKKGLFKTLLKLFPCLIDKKDFI